MAGADTDHSPESRRRVNGRLASGQHRCEECEFVAEDDEGLQAHRTIHEANDVKDNVKYVNNTLSYQNYVSPDANAYNSDSSYNNGKSVSVSESMNAMVVPLASETNIQAPRPDLQCSLCEYIAFTDANLSSHMKTHQTRKSYTCDVCGMRFSQAANMRRHRMRHTGFKPYECKVCGKRFFRKDHLAEHLGTHSKTHKLHKGVKKLQKGAAPSLLPALWRKLGYPEPPNSTAYPRHSMVDSLSAPASIYKCAICDKTFQRHYNLKLHQAEHMGEAELSVSPENSHDSNHNVDPSVGNHADASSALRAMATDARPMKFISLLTNSVVTSSASSSPEKLGNGNGSGSADSTSPQPKGCYGDEHDRQSSGSGGSATDVLSSIFGDASRTRSLLTQSYAEQMGAFTLGGIVPGSRGANYRPYESPSLRSLLRTGRVSLDAAPPGDDVAPSVGADDAAAAVVVKQEPVDPAEQASPRDDDDEDAARDVDMVAGGNNGKSSPRSAEKSDSPRSEPSPPAQRVSENKRKGIPQHYIRNGHDSNEEGAAAAGGGDDGGQFSSIRSALISRGVALQQARAPMVSLLKQRQGRTVSSYLGSGSLLSTALSAPTSSSLQTFARGGAGGGARIAATSPAVDAEMESARGGGAHKMADASMSCPFCGIVYFDQTLYFLHKALHSDSNPWKCNVCGLQCQNKYDFNSHVLSIAHN
ncbi:PREDICTED: zinc finger protein Pegasus-like [Priapulus caudatus]|uniref:Zinc finger protein Pegasus-like n=1 Tax=Priapulus caudatus TaxID=37621 RepID=A0ABM1EU42_PRICU|nr:PREDICTED: zinc finger protein Pegasus-like [Priapulus caudatus]